MLQTPKETSPMTIRWNIDAAHSGINFSVRHMVISKVRGRFGASTGTVELDKVNLNKPAPQAKIEPQIDPASIDTGTAQRDTHLKSADFFDAEKFPQLRFRSTR